MADDVIDIGSPYPYAETPDIYTFFTVTGPVTRSTLAREVFLFEWDEQDLHIPWPEGLTPREAILQWSDAQRKREALNG